MRFLWILTAAAVYTFQEDNPSRGNGVEPLHFETDKLSVKKVNQSGAEDIDITKILQTTSSSLSTLADIPMRKFAETYLKMTPKQLIGFLKGFSVAGQIIAAFIEPEDRGYTDEILNAISKGFSRMEEKLKTHTSDLKMYMDNIAYFQQVVTPVFKATEATTKHMNKRIPRDEYLRLYNNADVEDATAMILSYSSQLLENVIYGARHNQNKFKDMRNSLLGYLMEVHSLQLYYIGVRFKNKTKYEEQEMYHNEDVINQTLQLDQICRQMYEVFEKTSFPGFILEDIIRPTIDCIVGKDTNCILTGGHSDAKCLIASNILNKTSTKFPWRQYAVLVATSKSTDKNNMVKFDKTSIIEREYEGYDIVMFMSTKQYKQSKRKYNEEKIRETINSYNNKDVPVSQFLSLVQNNGRNTQMAVVPYMGGGSDCFLATDENISDHIYVILMKYSGRLLIMSDYDIYLVF